MTDTATLERSVGAAASVLDFKSKTSGFRTEREFVDFVEANLEHFCREIQGAVYESHVREWTLNGARRFGGNKPKIDLMVMTTTGKRIGIECKFPAGGAFSELSRVVSQTLSYAVIAEDNDVAFSDLYILTTEYHDIVDRTISRYNLPIKVIVFSRHQRAEWYGN